MHNEFITAREKAANRIFMGGSFKINTNPGEGFKLAIHEDLPEAPLSPFYLNLRPKGVKGGLLDKSDIWSISTSMYLLADKHELLLWNRRICSIPAAGDPFLDCMLGDVMDERGGINPPTRIRLIKSPATGIRSFHLDSANLTIPKATVLVDDLVASMMTKFLAIGAINTAGGTVSDLLVFLDRSADAQKKLAEMDISLHAVWNFEQLMEWALGRGYLKRNQFDIVMDYPDKLAAYKKAVNYKG